MFNKLNFYAPLEDCHYFVLLVFFITLIPVKLRLSMFIELLKCYCGPQATGQLSVPHFHHASTRIRANIYSCRIPKGAGH